MASQVARKSGKGLCDAHHSKGILHEILCKEHPREMDVQRYPPNCSVRSGGCSCVDGRRVVLKTPEVTCKRASEVLLKTSTFIRNLPSFYHVPWEDQAALIQQNWAPLFVLGLAQEGVDFELREISAPSLLKKILLNQSPTACDEPGGSSLGAPLAAVQKMKNLLWKLWDLDLSAKEYAYLKGIILFNSGPPKLGEGKEKAWCRADLGYERKFNKASRNAEAQRGKWLGLEHDKQAQQDFLRALRKLLGLSSGGNVTGRHVLKCLPYVQTLQQEAQEALLEFISMMFNSRLGRFAWILQLLTSLRDIDADVIEELFFRSILGEVTINELLLEVLYIKPDWL